MKIDLREKAKIGRALLYSRLVFPRESFSFDVATYIDPSMELQANYPFLDDLMLAEEAKIAKAAAAERAWIAGAADREWSKAQAIIEQKREKEIRAAGIRYEREARREKARKQRERNKSRAILILEEKRQQKATQYAIYLAKQAARLAKKSARRRPASTTDGMNPNKETR